MVKKITWQSDNGKYKILARLFDDKSYHVTCFLKKKGRFSVATKRNLPKYVKAKMHELEREVIKFD